MLQFDAAEISFCFEFTPTIDWYKYDQGKFVSAGFQTHLKRFIQWIWIYRRCDVESTIFVYDIVICHHLQNFSNFFHASLLKTLLTNLPTPTRTWNIQIGCKMF